MDKDSFPEDNENPKVDILNGKIREFALQNQAP